MRLQLLRGNHRFEIRYDVGEEAKVLETLIDMINNPDVKFDWFDAAILTHQMGHHLAQELKGYLPKVKK